MKPNIVNRLTLLGALLGAASPLAVSVGALGQESSDQESVVQENAVDAVQEETTEAAQTAEVIQVQGSRGIVEQALVAKRNSKSLADFVVQDDMGRLPDFDVSEALRRIPGVASSQTSERESYITIRGLNGEYNYTALDGALVASTAADTREVLLDVVPSSVIKKAAVYKVFTPELEGQAIGGYLAMETRSAFDRNGRYTNMYGDVGVFSHNDDGPYQADPSYRLGFAVSDTFNDQIGVTLAGSVRTQAYNTYTPTIAGNRYDFYRTETTGGRLGSQDPYDEDTNGWPVPQRNAQFLYNYDRFFYGGLAKVEFRPLSNFSGFVQAFYFRSDDNTKRDSMEWLRTNRNYTPSDWTAYSGTVPIRMLASPAAVEWDITDQVYAFQGVGEYVFANNSVLDINLSRSIGKYDAPFTQFRFSDRTSGADDSLGFSYDFGGDYMNYPVWTPLDADAYSNWSAYTHSNSRFTDRAIDENSTEFKLDYSHNVESSDLGLGYKVGLKYQDSVRKDDQSWIEYDLVSGSDYTLDMVLDPAEFTTPGTHVTALPFIDRDAALAFFEANPDLFAEDGNTQRYSTQSDYEVGEKVAAAYGQLEYQTDKVNVIGGVRYEKTMLDTWGYERRGSEYPEITVKHNYENWLPRVLFSYDMTSDVVLKAAYSKSVGRARYSYLRPNQTVTVDVEDNTVRYSGGNPTLEPRVSDNFDLSAEYYLDAAEGLLSLAVFHKAIADEYLTRSVQTTESVEGLIDATVTTSQPINITDAELTGVELGAVVGTLGFITPALDGFGFTSNYTYIESNAVYDSYYDDVGLRDLPTLRGQPEHTVNFTGFAKLGEFEARAAYNWQSEYLNAINGREWYDRMWDARGVLDLQLRYNVNDDLIVLAQAKNATDTYASEYNAFGSYFSRRDSGQQFWFGFSYRN